MTSSIENPPTPRSWWRLSDGELAHSLIELETARRRLEAQILSVIAEADARGLAYRMLHASLTTVVQELTMSSRATAAKLVKRAQALRHLPATAAAVTDGTIGGEHLDVITDFRRSLSEAVHPEDWESAEPILVDLAKSTGPAALRRFANTELRPRLDPDGALPAENDLAEPRNELSLRFRDNGWLDFKGRLEPESAALWAAQLAPGSEPDRSGENGPDLRTLERRQGDALEEWVSTGHAGLPMPAEGGERPQLMVTIGLDALRSGLGHATLGPDLLPVSVSEARRLACDCQVIPVVLSADSVPIEIGRASRNIPPHIRRLVVNRDRGCSFPGCARPASHCDAHHLHEWQHGGVTEPHNLALLCKRHHRLVHHSEWQVRMSSTGRPEYIPPDYLAPARRPRTNQVHRMRN